MRRILSKMNLTALKSSKWLTNYSMWINLAQWLGGIIVVYLLAKLVWVWVEYFASSNEIKPLKASRQTSAATSKRINVNSLIERNIFGRVVQETKKPEVVQENFKETKLNLKLRGIYAADIKSKANAIIEDGRGKQEVYFIDEKLEVGGSVFLRQVFVDKVILETNGRRESLTLETKEMPNSIVTKKDNRKSDSRSSRGKRVEDKRGDQRLSRQLNEYRNKFKENPASVADIINGRPHMVNGELQGFIISPGKDKRLFQELGLRPRDIVKSINGVALNNMQDAMTLMNEAKTMTEVSVDIQRGDQQLSLLLNLNEKVGR